MFAKIGRAAERTAAGVSRRWFLGRLGQWAMAAAGALGGLLATSGAARASGGTHRSYRCQYDCGIVIISCRNCPQQYAGCQLVSKSAWGIC